MSDGSFFEVVPLVRLSDAAMHLEQWLDADGLRREQIGEDNVRQGVHRTVHGSESNYAIRTSPSSEAAQWPLF